MSTPTPTISLSVATIGRTVELARLLDTLADPANPALEVILVDQNADDRVGAVVAAAPPGLEIRHLRTPPVGASAARNLGADAARAPIIGFPDDDCWFPPTTLSRVAAWMDAHPAYDVLCGMARTATGAPSTGRWERDAGDITRAGVWKQSIEFASFFRRPVFSAAGGFDPMIGPGAPSPFGANEIDDLLLRLLAAGHRLRYEPDLVVHHAEPVAVYDAAARTRAARYGRGTGHVLRRHGFGTATALKTVARPLAGAGVALVQGRAGLARYRVAIAAGRWAGWRATEKP